MDELFAPWRIDWVRRPDRTGEGCPFCRLPAAGDDEEALIVARRERSYVLLNNAPYNPGHAMVIPDRHVTDVRSLSDEELLDRDRLVQATVETIDRAMDPDGYNTGTNLGGAGGGSIPHLHTHVVPRWRGDTNFMAVLDDTKVIVQALEETYAELHQAFAEQPEATVSETGAVRLSSD